MIRYDAPRVNKIEAFLKQMNKISLQNPNVDLDDRIIYSELCKFGLKPNDFEDNREYKNISKLFDAWVERYKDSKKLRVYKGNREKYFLEFVSKKELPFLEGLMPAGSASIDKFIKLYIPIDHNHIYKSANKIFDYIEKLDVPHQSKIASKIRSDNIVIRLNESKEEIAKSIIDFVNNDPYIKEGLNEPNPFIPTVKGIGYMKDNGKSYNSELSFIIRDYIYYNRHNNINEVSVESFAKFYKMYCKYTEYQNAFNIATGNILEKSVSQKKAKEISTYTKNKMILEALRQTYTKHGIEQIEYAITEILDKNNFNYITNGDNNLRDFLKNNVGQEYFKNYIKQTLSLSGYKFGDNSYNAKIICQLLFSNSLAINIDKICKATYENYDKEQLEYALEEYIKHDSSTKFSRFSKEDIEHKENLRELLTKYSKENLIEALITSLRFRGIEVKTIGTTIDPDNIINQYVNILVSELEQTKK